MRLRHIRKMSDVGVNTINRLIDEVNAARNIHVSGMVMTQTQSGMTLRTKPGTPAGGGGGGGAPIRTAYCKADAPAASVIPCWLDYNGVPAPEWDANRIFKKLDYAEHSGDVYKSLQDLNEDKEPGEVGSETWWEIVTVGTTAEAYAAGATYGAGGLCTSGGTAYRSLQADNIGNTPASSAEWWVELTSIDVYCRIANGHRLDFAFPVLLAGQRMYVVPDGAGWIAQTLFAGAEESCAEGGLLELVSQRVAVDQVSNSTVMQEVGDTWPDWLRFDAAANCDYVVEFDLIYSTDGADLKLDINTTTTGSSISGVFTGNDGGAYAGKVITAFEAAITFAGSGYISGKFLIKSGSTGRFNLRFGSSANGQDVTLLSGSNIRFRRTHYVYPGGV